MKICSIIDKQNCIFLYKEGGKISTRDIILRIGLSILLGGLVGFQREVNRNSAGFRTHILVCLGACMAMITNEYLYYQFPEAQIDVARMGSYVISGIGFLGAGSILKDGFRVRGLTTAAGLWVVACLGLAAGAGFYQAALIGGGTVVAVLVLLKLFESRYMKRSDRIVIELRIKNTKGNLANALSIIGNAGVKIKDIDIKNNESKWVEAAIFTSRPNNTILIELQENLKKEENIIIESIDSLD